MILDRFSAHLSDEIVQSLRECKTRPEYIVGGYTSKLQVLDGLNRPFKHRVGEKFQQFIRANFDPDTNKVHKPRLANVAHWISNSWNAISGESIINTWRNVGTVTEEGIL